MSKTNTFNCLETLKIDGEEFHYYSLKSLASNYPEIAKLPFSLKILLENLLRNEVGKQISSTEIKKLIEWVKNPVGGGEILFHPARILMQDFTGVPAVVDLAAMRDAMEAINSDASLINPLIPVDLVIDHSVVVDFFGNKEALEKNVQMEFKRNYERYSFLKWGQKAFKNFRVVPPGMGICHQVNLENLAKVVQSSKINNKQILFPDTVVGTDSHTTMINALGVLGWGVGGIEAEAAMLGQAISMLIPQVVGVKLSGKLNKGITATDLVLAITQRLREKGVVEKFVEYFGEGIKDLSIADRATISNMSPEYGATCGIFPIDSNTCNYLKFTGRDNSIIKRVEEYAKIQGLWYDENSPDSVYSDVVEINLSEIEASIAGPKRPQDNVKITEAKKAFAKYSLQENADSEKEYHVEGKNFNLKNGNVVLAAITSCTNTSNPHILVCAGLVAKKAVEFGLNSKPWVKTSLAPGSHVVSDYLENSQLQKYLNQIGFYLVGYGCTTCIGNSGALEEDIAKCINDNKLLVAGVLSGNRNFEGRIHPQIKANYLASPPLVVAYALAGTMNIDLSQDPIGISNSGEKVFLKDLWPDVAEINEYVDKFVKAHDYEKRYANVFKGTEQWRKIEIDPNITYKWQDTSTYVQKPPYFENFTKNNESRQNDIVDAKLLLLLGDSITTDHISPAGSFSSQTTAGKYLIEKNIHPAEFNSYGSRRGNHQIMLRGTFANIRIKNLLVPQGEGGVTIYKGKEMSIYEAAEKYKADNRDLIVIAGKEYGTGSSRDWAAKGTKLLGVRAVIAESFERIHRSNLIGMGVLPLVFDNGVTQESLNLSGDESFDITPLQNLSPSAKLKLIVKDENGNVKNEYGLICRIDTLQEMQYFQNGGLLPFMVRSLSKAETTHT